MIVIFTVNRIAISLGSFLVRFDCLTGSGGAGAWSVFGTNGIGGATVGTTKKVFVPSTLRLSSPSSYLAPWNAVTIFFNSYITKNTLLSSQWDVTIVPVLLMTLNGRGLKQVEDLFCLCCWTITVSPTLRSDGIVLLFVSAFFSSYIFHLLVSFFHLAVFVWH